MIAKQSQASPTNQLLLSFPQFPVRHPAYAQSSIKSGNAPTGLFFCLSFPPDSFCAREKSYSWNKAMWTVPVGGSRQNENGGPTGPTGRPTGGL